MKKFINYFVKSEEGFEQNDVQNVNPSASTPNINNVSGVSRQVVDSSAEVNIPTPTQSSPKSISADDVIINKIWDKIIEANRPGPDYLELKNNIDALEDLPISNEQKLISAFKVLQKGYPNLKKEDIPKAIDFYIGVVNDEKNAGLKQLDELRAISVDGAENEIKTMQARAEELKRQYDELQSSIGAKSIELSQAKNDIEMKYNSFIGSVDAVMNVLTSDKENIMSINF